MTLEFNKNIRTFLKENERVFNCNIISSIQRAIDRDEQKLNAKKSENRKKKKLIENAKGRERDRESSL